ncbi:MAG TPA: ATP-binding protein [Anaerolineae bacterium]|nr:ATP-binding protein [Anaerolineae bacterium]
MAGQACQIAGADNEHARLLQAEQQQSRRLALLAEVARIVATNLDAGGLLQDVAESIRRRQSIESGIVGTVARTGQPHLAPLDNLLDNAIKFTPAGGVITLQNQQEGAQVALQVSDMGVGIPPDQLERIFERFYQVNGSIWRRYGGIGLGLALVKEIARTYNGQVSVESQVGEGSTFRVLLPVAGDTLQTKEDPHGT